jgi:nicotinamidase-related amidase
VCVKQTCFDLLERDYDVTLVVDAISSMGLHDRTLGIEAMRDAGAQVTSY